MALVGYWFSMAVLYTFPEILWLMPPLMLYWISRVWLKTHRGEMHDDPIVFAAGDRPSLIAGALLVNRSSWIR